MRAIKFFLYCLFALPKILIYAVLNSTSKPIKNKKNRKTINFAGLLLMSLVITHVIKYMETECQKIDYSSYDSVRHRYDHSYDYIDKRTPYQKLLCPKYPPKQDRNAQVSNEPSVWLALPEKVYPVAAGLFFWACWGGAIVRFLFRKGTPIERLKARYQELYPKVNKVVVTPKSKNKGETLKSITSRLPPHLQELISKK